MGALQGVRVVDFSRVLAGPHCAQTLLDLGADVIKVEPPSADLSRFAFPQRDHGISGYYAQQNAGKRNVSIDLNVDGAREVARELCARADVVVENFRPGTLASFGLGYDDVAATNPGVVYVSISGYGQHGEWSSRSAYAPTVQAEAGLTAITAAQFGTGDDLADDDERPRSDSLSHADVYAGLHAAIAVLAALHRRERTGVGEYVDVAMAAVMLSINERVHTDLDDEDLGAEVPVLGATDCPFFVSPEGDTIVCPMSLVGSLSFPFYLGAMRRPDLADDPRFATPQARAMHRGELHSIIQDWISTFTDMASLDAQFDEAKIASGRVRTLREIADSDWAHDWGAVRSVPDRSGGAIRLPGRPWHFTGDTGAVDDARVPAQQGEHNRAVLTELGYGETAIADLRARGALVEPDGGTG